MVLRPVSAASRGARPSSTLPGPRQPSKRDNLDRSARHPCGISRHQLKRERCA